MKILRFEKKNNNTLKSKINSIHYNDAFQKDIHINMVNNLIYFNNLKLYQENESLYLSILNELKEIKKLMERNHIILNNNNFMENHNMICNMIIKYFNHISCDNFSHIFKLLLGDDWCDEYNMDDLEMILFITRFIKPISVWDSEFHTNEIPYIQSQEDTINNKKKTSALTKDIIDSLLGIVPKNSMNDDMNINSIIINTGLNPNVADPKLPFLKSINDLIELNSKKNISKRVNHYNKSEVIALLDNKSIYITKNNKSTTLLEDKSGVLIYIKNTIRNKVLVIQGIFKDDLLNLAIDNMFIKEKLSTLKNFMTTNSLTVPSYFKDNYLKILSLRDIVVSYHHEICEDIKKKYNDFRTLQSKTLLSLINEFLLASKYRKIDILTLLLMSHEDDMKLAFILFDVFKSKDKKDVSTEVYKSLHCSIRELLDVSKEKVEKEESELSKIVDSDIPYEKRIILLKTNDDVKSKAMEKLKAMKTSFQGDSKSQTWLDGLLKIQFNT